MARFPLKTVVQYRSCGGCRACCTTLGVEEYGKPQWTSCRHECDAGCAIYDSPDRPSACRGYACLWVAGLLEGDERRRPNQLGVVFDSRKEGSATTIQAWEVWPNALDQPQARYLIDRIGERVPVLLRRHPASLAFVPMTARE